MGIIFHSPYWYMELLWIPLWTDLAIDQDCCLFKSLGWDQYISNIKKKTWWDWWNRKSLGFAWLARSPLWFLYGKCTSFPKPFIFYVAVYDGCNTCEMSFWRFLLTQIILVVLDASPLVLCELVVIFRTFLKAQKSVRHFIARYSPFIKWLL